MEQQEIIYTKKDVIEKYKPMFTEWSLSKLIREGKIKYIRVGRRIFITKNAVDEFISNQQERSILGMENKFNSPFREDRRPSFSVNEKGYIDFGSGNYYGDIIQFVKELRGYQFPYQAAEEIIDVFGLDITIPEKAISVKEKKTRKKTSELYLQKSDKSNKVICMFDSQGYQSKPQKEQIAYIKSRISNLRLQEYTLQEIKDNITNGRTIIPSGIKGNAKENWEKQQIFLVDFDNVFKGNKLYKDDPEHITPEQILKYCKKIHLEPTFIYTTFSHTEEQNKFRLVYALEKPITDYEMASKIPQLLLNVFRDFHPDTSKQNLADMFFGGQEIVYQSNILYNVLKRNIEYEEVEYKEGKIIDKPSHDIIARKLLQENQIRVFENTLYIYENGVYRKNEKSIHRKTIEIYPKATTRMQKEVISYLLTMAPEVQVKHENLINFKNGLYDLNKNIIMQHSPYFFTINQINANIICEPAKIVAVDIFLDKISCYNKKRKRAILQMIGYSMTTSVDMQKEFVLYGKTAGNGRKFHLKCNKNLIKK